VYSKLDSVLKPFPNIAAVMARCQCLMFVPKRQNLLPSPKTKKMSYCLWFLSKGKNYLQLNLYRLNNISVCIVARKSLSAHNSEYYRYLTETKGGVTVLIGCQGKFLMSSSMAPNLISHTSHPSSIDALCALPSSYPSSHSTILTGSSDGLLRAVQLLPTKLIGVIADHGSFPIERIAIDRGGEGRWVGSAGHEDVLKLTDLKEVFEDEDKDDGIDEAGDEEEKDESKCDGDEENQELEDLSKTTEPEARANASGDDDEDSDVPKGKKRKRKQEKDVLAPRGKKKGRNQVEAEPSFFSGL